MQVIDVQRSIHAPADRAFAVLTEHEAMWRWTPGVKRVELDPEGAPDRNGLGAVRKIHMPGMVLAEEVVGWLPPHWYEYRVVGGGPIRDHLGRVEVTPEGDDRCTVRWRIEFRGALPGLGLITRLALGTAIRKMLDNAKAIIEADVTHVAA